MVQNILGKSTVRQIFRFHRVSQWQSWQLTQYFDFSFSDSKKTRKWWFFSTLMQLKNIKCDLWNNINLFVPSVSVRLMTEVLVNSIKIDKHFKKRHVTQLYSEILQRYVTSLKIFISLFATHCNRERWRNRGRQRERFHLPIHSPHAQNAKQELTEDWNQELYCCLFYGWWILNGCFILWHLARWWAESCTRSGTARTPTVGMMSSQVVDFQT